MTGMPDFDLFKICMQVHVWLGFRPLTLLQLKTLNVRETFDFYVLSSTQRLQRIQRTEFIL